MHGRGGFGAGVAGPALHQMGNYFRGHGRTARRGDVRASILALLAERPMHGYQVIQELETRSEGRWRPSAGSVYPTLQQLEDEGLVRSEELDGRRVFSLTDAANAELARRAEAPGAPWESMGRSDDAAFDLRRLSVQLGAAAMQVAQVGSGRSIEQARDVLVDARRRLYRILAEDETDEPGPADAADAADAAPEA
ncbi:MAG: PadR family transcriptional regulator [Candidatus Limnocylindrales bacterium]